MKPYKLNNGMEMPPIGLGTWNIDDKKAIKMGYTAIDCSPAYGNEKLIGKGLKNVLKEVPRDKLFLSSKLWNTHHGHVEEACKQTLKNLGVDYLDLYYMHWPISFEFTGIDLEDGKVEQAPLGEDMRVKLGRVSVSDTWKQMEKLVEDGLVKSLGISNFGILQVLDLLSYAKIKPAVHQYECSPLLQKPKMHENLKLWNIQPADYSQFGCWDGASLLLKNEKLVKLAEEKKKSPAQIVLRWAIQRGHVVNPKSSGEERLKENLEVFNFELSSKEMSEIEKIDERKSFMQWKVHTAFGFCPWE